MNSTSTMDGSMSKDFFHKGWETDNLILEHLQHLFVEFVAYGCVPLVEDSRTLDLKLEGEALGIRVLV